MKLARDSLIRYHMTQFKQHAALMRLNTQEQDLYISKAQRAYIDEEIALLDFVVDSLQGLLKKN